MVHKQGKHTYSEPKQGQQRLRLVRAGISWFQVASGDGYTGSKHGPALDS